MLNMRILRLPEVVQITGLSRSTIYLRIEAKTFPKQINLGGRAVGWVDESIDEWMQNLIKESLTP